MGGRDQRRDDKKIPDREQWVREISDSRLLNYRRMLLSAGKVERLDGSPRTADQQAYFTDLIAREMSRRKI
jgi:hypothetical protein